MRKEPIYTRRVYKGSWKSHLKDYASKYKQQKEVSSLYNMPVCFVCGEDKKYDVGTFEYACDKRKHIIVVPPLYKRVILDEWLAEFWR